jgi:hypothetical protein
VGQLALDQLGATVQVERVAHPVPLDRAELARGVLDGAISRILGASQTFCAQCEVCGGPSAVTTRP